MTDFGDRLRERKGWPDLDPWAVLPDLANLTAQLAERLERIRLRVEPGRSGSWTFDDAMKEIGWIDDECRLAREDAEVFQKRYNE